MNGIRKIVKRDGRTVDYDINKIADAIFKAAQSLGGSDHELSVEIAHEVEDYLLDVCHNQVPTVEQIQDAVEKVLIEKAMPGLPRNTSFTELSVQEPVT